jgi:valyl-tRNA synthetase
MELSIADFFILVSLSMLSISMAVQVQNRARTTIAVVVALLINTITVCIFIVNSASIAYSIKEAFGSSAPLTPISVQVVKKKPTLKIKSSGPSKKFVKTFRDFNRNVLKQTQAQFVKISQFPLEELSQLDDQAYNSLQNQCNRSQKIIAKLINELANIKAPTQELQENLNRLNQTLIDLAIATKSTEKFLKSPSYLKEKQALEEYQASLSRVQKLLTIIHF